MTKITATQITKGMTIMVKDVYTGVRGNMVASLGTPTTKKSVKLEVNGVEWENTNTHKSNGTTVGLRGIILDTNMGLVTVSSRQRVTLVA